MNRRAVREPKALKTDVVHRDEVLGDLERRNVRPEPKAFETEVEHRDKLVVERRNVLREPKGKKMPALRTDEMIYVGTAEIWYQGMMSV
jgi:hypothetical protein